MHQGENTDDTKDDNLANDVPCHKDNTDKYNKTALHHADRCEPNSTITTCLRNQSHLITYRLDSILIYIHV